MISLYFSSFKSIFSNFREKKQRLWLTMWRHGKSDMFAAAMEMGQIDWEVPHNLGGPIFNTRRELLTRPVRRRYYY